MPLYEKNFITQVVLRADLQPETAPLVRPDEAILAALDAFPVRNGINRTKNEVHIRKGPQGPVRDTRTTNFVEHNFWNADKTRRIALCGEYLFLEEKRYESYAVLREQFLDVLDTLAEHFPNLRIRRLGMRYINEIRLPEADAGPGLGADFWQKYINPFLLGGLRFAANDGALARHMCTTELNYGADRATIKYGIFNGEYPKPNRRREFVLDVDTFRAEPLAPDAVPARLDEFHSAACSVFEAAVTDALRARMGVRP